MALGYLGSGRLAQGDPRGADDIERAIALGAAETRLETRVRTYVNAAGSAYRAGRMHDAERYVAEGLRLAADGEFAAGQYRLHLTSAAVGMSTGDWDRAIAELRQLVTGPGQPGVMALLARALLARLLARRGDPEASAVLDEALRDPLSAGDSYVAGPLAVAQVELGWLTGTVDGVPPRSTGRCELAVDSGHTAIQAELCGYLRRAGHDLAAPDDVPGPWAPALAGRVAPGGAGVGEARRPLRAGGGAGVVGRRQGARRRAGHPDGARRDGDGCPGARPRRLNRPPAKQRRAGRSRPALRPHWHRC